MKSLQFLFEVFLPEARFPDEKFWNKDGSAIHPDPKGPPKGTVGMKHGDVGAQDADDQPSPGPTPIYPALKDVQIDHPEAYRALGSVLKDLGTSEQDLPEEAFLYDEHGNMTVTIPHSVANDGVTHELWWNDRGKSWEYVT